MFFGTFWEHHTCLYNYHVLIISYLCAILCYSEEIAKYVPIVVKLCYAIAGVVAVVGAISVYIAMNNEEQEKCYFVFVFCYIGGSFSLLLKVHVRYGFQC